MKSKRKIGVVLNHVSQRSDIRLFIEELSRREDVVLFGSEEEQELIDLNYYEFREVVNVNSWFFTFYNRVLRFIYFFIGNLPKTRRAFNDYQIRLINKAENNTKNRKRMIRHKIRMLMPHFFSYDLFLRLFASGDTEIDDIDLFIAYTDLNHESLLSKVKKSGGKLIVYIHSWDHIPKFTKFPKNEVKYITWNKQIRQDLIQIHGVSHNLIKELGASQFYFINNYLSEPVLKKPFDGVPYIYFPCSFGYPIVARQEVKIIGFLAKTLREISEEVKLVVRAYPMLMNWGIYDSLKELDNILFDDYQKMHSTGLSKSNHLKKSWLIDHSMAIFHAGTTIGIEASYFSKPVVYVNIKDIDYGISISDRNHIQYSWNQYHLKKYYALEGYEEVINTCDAAKRYITKLVNNGPSIPLEYNETLSSYSPLMKIEDFTKQFVELIDN